MALETTGSATTFLNLSPDYPSAGEAYSESWAHVVNMKHASQRMFPLCDSAVLATAIELNHLGPDPVYQGTIDAIDGYGKVLLYDLDVDFRTLGITAGVDHVMVLESSDTATINGVYDGLLTLGTPYWAQSSSPGHTWRIDFGNQDPNRLLYTAVQTQLTQLVTDRQAMSNSVNVALQTLSATLNTREQLMSSSAQAQLDTLSATMTAAKLHVTGTSSTAGNTIQWGENYIAISSSTPTETTNTIWFQVGDEVL